MADDAEHQRWPEVVGASPYAKPMNGNSRRWGKGGLSGGGEGLGENEARQRLGGAGTEVWRSLSEDAVAGCGGGRVRRLQEQH